MINTERRTRSIEPAAFSPSRNRIDSSLSDAHAARKNFNRHKKVLLLAFLLEAVHC
jgi:hypothetical protein